MKKKFRIFIPVDMTVTEKTDLRSFWEDVRAAGTQFESSDGSRYDVRTDKITLSELRALAQGKAVDHG